MKEGGDMEVQFEDGRKTSIASRLRHPAASPIWLTSCRECGQLASRAPARSVRMKTMAASWQVTTNQHVRLSLGTVN